MFFFYLYFFIVLDYKLKELCENIEVNRHGAHSREEQGHADEDVNSNHSL